MGQGYTSCYMNNGVTFWHLPSSRSMRAEIVQRGRQAARTIYGDNQIAFNEVIHTKYYDQLVLLPSQYNCRAYLNVKKKHWPTFSSLDGIMIYHCGACIERAKTFLPVQAKAELPLLTTAPCPQSPTGQFLRRLQYRMQRHLLGRREL